MTLLNTATHPLEFAYQAAKRMYWGNEQSVRLREIAAGYNSSINPLETDKALLILVEVRRIVTGNNDYFHDYPGLAVDFTQIQRPDLANTVINEAVRHAEKQCPSDQTILLIRAAQACLDMGETERCRQILPKMNQLLLAARLLEWDSGPLSLFLRLGMVKEAMEIAGAMDGHNKVCAFAEIAFHEQTSEMDRETFLAHAHTLAEQSDYVTDDFDIFDWARVHLAKHHAGNRHFGKALELARKTRNPDCHSKVLIAVADAKLRNGMNDKAIKVIETIRQACRERQRVEYVEYSRASLSRNFQYGWLPDKGLLSLTAPLREAGLEHIAGNILDETHAGVEGILDYTTRIDNLARLVRWFAPFNRGQAEKLLDHVVAAPLADLEPQKDHPSIKYSRTAPAILHRLAMDIRRNNLEWNEKRQELFRQHLEALPMYENCSFVG